MKLGTTAVQCLDLNISPACSYEVGYYSSAVFGFEYIPGVQL